MVFLLRRLAFYLAAFIAAATINFFLPRLMPGDPIRKAWTSAANLRASPWAITAVAGTHVCLRKVTAHDINAAIERYGVRLLAAARGSIERTRARRAKFSAVASRAMSSATVRSSRRMWWTSTVVNCSFDSS
jgi:ABC-type dipeptide/oligopeptide/nickel transport system permease component